MLTNDDLKKIKDIVTQTVAPLATKVDLLSSNVATKADFAKLDTKITKLDVKLSGQFAQLNEKMTKDVERLEKAIKTEYKRGNQDFGYLEKEDRKISIRVERIERHLGFAVATA